MTMLPQLIRTYLILFTIISSGASAADQHESKHDSKPGGVERLSTSLRALLSEEMKALQEGMMSVIPAYVSGNWKEIASTANQMQNSYIMKQKLTPAQTKELHAQLPLSFIELDQQFHYFAGMLKHAAKKQKPELVSFYYSKMSETCVSCHSKYATHRFPNFSQSTKKEKHAH